MLIVPECLAKGAKDVLRELFLHHLVDLEAFAPSQGLDEHFPSRLNVQIPIGEP
jgi:hypothetical protein